MTNAPDYASLYQSLTDDELMRLHGSDLVNAARSALTAEMAQRGLDGGKAAVEGAPAPKHAAPQPWVPPPLRRWVFSFRVLVIGSMLLWSLTTVVDWLLVHRFGPIDPGGWLSPRSYFFHHIGTMLWWLNHLLFLLAAISMCFFVWWSRYLYIAAYLFTIPVSFMLGFGLYIPLVSNLDSLVMLMDGAILTLAFASPLVPLFRRRGQAVSESRATSAEVG